MGRKSNDRPARPKPHVLDGHAIALNHYAYVDDRPRPTGTRRIVYIKKTPVSVTGELLEDHINVNEHECSSLLYLIADAYKSGHEPSGQELWRAFETEFKAVPSDAWGNSSPEMGGNPEALAWARNLGKPSRPAAAPAAGLATNQL